MLNQHLSYCDRKITDFWQLCFSVHKAIVVELLVLTFRY